MLSENTKPPRRALRKADLAKRYGDTTTRNIEYKLADGTLPPPDFYFGRYPLWWEETLDERDRLAVITANQK
jgi:hypothetical protein